MPNETVLKQTDSDIKTSPRIWPVGLLALTGLGCMLIPTLLGLDDSVRFLTLALGAAGHLLLLAGWVFFGSRVPWVDRIRFLVLGMFGLVALFVLQDRSLGIMVILFGAPIAATCLAVALFGTQRMAWANGSGSHMLLGLCPCRCGCWLAPME